MFLSSQSFSPAEHLLYLFGGHPIILIKQVACINRHLRHGTMASCSIHQQAAKPLKFCICSHMSYFITPAK